MEQLSNSNFLLHAMHNFNVPSCIDVEEFNEEVKRFRYISRAFKIEVFNTRLVLNHIIILYNVFGNATTNMLLFKVDKVQWTYLIPFLIYLNRLTNEQLDEIMVDINLNETIINELRNL